MNAKRAKTAEEVMAELNADPLARAKRRERDARLALLEETSCRIQRPILIELAELGVHVSAIHELVDHYSPLSAAVVGVLLFWLKHLRDDRLQEMLIRCLGAAAEPFDGRPLQECFQTTSDEAVKFAILNTIALAHPEGIDPWVVELRAHPYWGRKLDDLER